MARDIYEDVDEIDPEAGSNALGNTVVILTTVALVVACILLQKALGDHYGAGLFAG
jgi:hypothetical protein